MRSSQFARRGLRSFLAVCLLSLLSYGTSPVHAATPVDWQGWTFEHEVSPLFDGLSLRKVKYKGRALIDKLSFPVMRVFYDDDACGPYADRLGGRIFEISWVDNALVAEREFTGPDGKQWYEIGIRDLIGNYDIYQVYYLSADGEIEAHVFSRGLQCVVNHIHYPNWRIDFDLDGPEADEIQVDDGNGFVTLGQEFDKSANSSPAHAWRVRDSATGLQVDVLPGFTDFNLSGDNTTVPVTGFENNTVFGRLYKLAEDTIWRFGPNVQVLGNDGENIDKGDVVLWYEGYMPHAATDGESLWHSTGVRLVAGLNGEPPPPQPENIRTLMGGPLKLADWTKASEFPATVQVVKMPGVIKKVTVQLSGLTHTYPDDIDVALIGPGGQTVKLMSDVGGSRDISKIDLTFDAAAATSLPDKLQLKRGTYLPTNVGDGDPFPSPAPFIGNTTDLDVFKGQNPNGAWRLFVLDDQRVDEGMLNGGWSLTIETE